MAVIAGLVVLPAGRASAGNPLDRQDPPPPDTTVADTTLADAPVADSAPADGVAADAARTDSAAVDSLPPPPILPALDDVVPARGLPGVWEWDRNALLAARGQTLLELLAQVPGVLAVRGGDFGAPATAIPVGLAGGGLRVYYDGVEHLPLAGAVPDLSRVALSGLERVRVIRRGSGIDVHLFRFVHSDARPYSLIEAGTGDLDTNVLRATFSFPRLVRGKGAAALERLDAQGPEDAGAITGGWFRYSLHRGNAAGLRFEYRRVSAQQAVPAEAPAVGAQRTDWTVQGAWSPLDGLLAAAWATGASIAPSPDSAPVSGPAAVAPLARRQYGASVSGRAQWVWGRAALRANDGAGVPERELSAEVSAAHPRWGGANLHAWREVWGGDAGLGYDLRAWAAPASFLTVFGEVGDGRRSAALPGADPLPVDSAGSGRDDESSDPPASRFVDRTRALYGASAHRWGFELSAARISVKADSVWPTQLPFDRDGLVLPQPERAGWELSVRVPLRPRGLFLRGQAQLWDARDTVSSSPDSVSAPAPSPVYFPDHAYDAALSFHRAFLATENFELWVDLGARGRAAMAVPVPQAPEEGDASQTDAEDEGEDVQLPAVVPFYQSWYLRVQMRFLSVNIFLNVENLTLRDYNQDVPGRLLPGTRSLYGVRWTLWN